MSQFTWNPPDCSAPIIFSPTATDYQLLKNYEGLTSIPAAHTYANKAPCRHGRRRKYTVLEERIVSLDILILSTDLEDLEDKVQALATALNPLNGTGVLQYTREDGTIYYLYCIGVQGNPFVSGTAVSPVYQKATIKLVADEDPFWHAGIPSIDYFDPNPANFFPFTFPLSLSSANSSKTLVNAGSVAAPVIVTFRGPMTNPKITNTYVAGGESVTDTLSLTLALAAGDILIIDTDPDIMTARHYPLAGGDLNAHKYVDTASKFWQLIRGNNLVELDPASASTGAIASVQWSERYVGV